MNLIVSAWLLYAGYTFTFNETTTNYHLTTQTGAFSGVLAEGVGITYGSFMLEGLVGYTPAVIGGETILSATIKNNIKWEKMYFGLGLVANLNDEDTFYVLPKRYPRHYYPATAIYSMPYIGIEHNGVYFELATLDYYLEAKLRDWDYFEWHEIGTWGIGYRYYLR